MIAKANLYKPGEFLLTEFELFLKPEELKEGRARADAFLEKQKKKTDQ